jgi:hypothetical protein
MARGSGGVGWVVAAGLLAAAAGCKDKERIRRSGDAGAPVERVDPSQAGEVLYGAEREPNEGEGQASPLPLPGGVQGVLDGEVDVDVFAVEIGDDGMLHVELSAVDGLDLVLEVRDAQGAVIARSDRGPPGVSEGVPNLGVSRGTVHVAVKEFVKPRKAPRSPKKGKGKPAAPPPDAAPTGRIGPSAPYRLSVRLEPAQALSERERNDDAGTAGDLYLADQVRGFIGWTGDVDVWKLSLEGLGAQNAIDVEVSGVPGLVLSLDVLDAAGRPIVSRKGGKGGPVAIRSLVAAPVEGAPPFLHVKVGADRSSPVDAYTLKVSPRLLDLDEESEPNDTAERATPLRVAGAESGTMRAAYTAGDVDTFAVEASGGPLLLDASVEVPGGVDFGLEARGAGGVILGTADAGKAGERERLSGVVIPAGTTAMVTVAARPIKVAGGDSGEPRPYQIRWSVSPADDAPPMPPEEGPATAPGAPPGQGEAN